MNLLEDHRKRITSTRNCPSIVLEKGSEVGSHGISGAVLDPRALTEPFLTGEDETFPLEHFVEREQMLLLTEKSGFGLPAMPPEFYDTGKPIISIARFQQWLAEKQKNEALKSSRPQLPNSSFTTENTVIGVRTRDRGM